MDKLDAILFEAASHADIEAEKSRVWMEITLRQSVQKRVRRYAVSAAALAATFAVGLFAGVVTTRGYLFVPELRIEVPQTDTLIPSTDGLPHFEYLADADWPSPLQGGSIDAFFPGWLPDGLPPAGPDSEYGWYSGDGDAKWVSCSLVAADDLRPELTAGLAAGRMRSCLVYEEAGGELTEIETVLCLGDGNYLSVSAAGIPYEDVIRVLEYIQP